MAVLVGIADAPAILAQSASGVPQWQAAAGGHTAFDVASVKLLKPGSRGRVPNFALDDGDGFTDPQSGESPHGRLSVAFPVSVYISFAYKLSLTPDQRQAMLARLPKWVDTDRIDIEAKAAGNPTKDQMRLMMQSLLAERFHLAVHYETQEMPVYALTRIKPGTWGPKLIRHADGPPCDVPGPQNPATGMSDPGADVFPLGASRRHRCQARMDALCMELETRRWLSSLGFWLGRLDGRWSIEPGFPTGSIIGWNGHLSRIVPGFPVWKLSPIRIP
jgi:uncharacterized protein (TIGR03435 family)